MHWEGIDGYFPTGGAQDVGTTFEHSDALSAPVPSRRYYRVRLLL